MKQILLVLLCAAMGLGWLCPVYGAGIEEEQAGAYLRQKGVYQGDASGNLMLDEPLNRAQLAAILTRLHGEGQADPAHYAWACYFEDVPGWAKPYVGYCVAGLLMKGYDSQWFGAGDPVTPKAACTVVLRICGYDSGEGQVWSYDTACDYAGSLGLLPESAAQTSAITRGDMAVLLYRALERPRQQKPAGSQRDHIRVRADGVVESKTIVQDDWSRQDFSQQANPAIFTGSYTRGWYNALRQTIVDREEILAGSDEKGFNPRYLYAHTRVAYAPSEQFHLFSEVLRKLYGYYYYRVGGEPYVKNPYEYPGYLTVEVELNWADEQTLAFIRPTIDSLAGKSDREKVIALNDYLCGLLAYGKEAGSPSPRDIFSHHDQPTLGVCAHYATAFSFLCTAADIPCVIVTSENHAWNQVYVEDQWLTVDVTNNDSSYHRDAYLLSHDAPGTDATPQATQFAKELLVPNSTPAGPASAGGHTPF